MKIINKISRFGLFLSAAIVLFSTSCREQLPSAMDTTDKFVEIKSIKIVNAGPSENEVIEGVINEASKQISFPRISPESNLNAIRFEVEASNGAVLDKDSYSFVFEEGESSKNLTIKLVNEPRFREYVVTLRLLVPVFGADFSKAVVYDYSNSSNSLGIYESFKSANVRGTGFDKETILIVDRGDNFVHLLNTEELKQGNVNPIPLNNTGITGGTFTLHSGAVVGDHIYAANLSGGQASPLKIYHWTDPTQAPAVIANINVAEISGAGVRHGDNMSVALDESGNGFIYFGDNAGTKILRLSVSGFTNITNPVVFNMPVAGPGAWTTYNRIGNSDEYIFTGHDAAIYLMNNSGGSQGNLLKTTVPARGSDARVFNFNGERYLMMLTAARTGSEPTVFMIYNITRGATVLEGLKNLEAAAERVPVYQYSLGGPVNINPATQTGYYIKKDAEGNDETLVVYGSSFQAGFIYVEIPKNALDD